MDSLRDPEVVEYNLLSSPGLTNTALNNKMVDMCELRGDALAVIDVDGGYQPPHESNSDRVARRGNVKTVVNNKKTKLQINSSYGCAYYPWVQIRDTINGVTLWAPPSVVAIGAMSYGEANSQLWFAPAGFTRGGLSANRAGGVPVVGVEEKLTVKQRDQLYDVQINPIASFPAEGIVIFGQKTLQIQQSALDRINVRRLLIYLKKQVSRFAATVLFDQNVEVTWARFKSKVEPFLADVKAGLGLTDYKVVLDETTTTPDLIDRNIMYAKIYIKPARAIEYIAIDFIITNTGASFED
jgi:phage tail sheath protein FI